MYDVIKNGKKCTILGPVSFSCVRVRYYTKLTSRVDHMVEKKEKLLKNRQILIEIADLCSDHGHMRIGSRDAL